MRIIEWRNFLWNLLLAEEVQANIYYYEFLRPVIWYIMLLGIQPNYHPLHVPNEVVEGINVLLNNNLSMKYLAFLQKMY